MSDETGRVLDAARDLADCELCALPAVNVVRRRMALTGEAYEVGRCRHHTDRFDLVLIGPGPE